MCEGFEPSMAFTADTLSRAPSITRPTLRAVRARSLPGLDERADQFKGEFRRPAICSVSKTIDIGLSIFLGVLRKSGVSSLPKRPSAMVKSVAVSSVALAPVAKRRNIRGLNDAASSDRSSASDRITASVAGDLPGVSRAIWTTPREAERTRRACGIRTP
jgi:hypothetical protein